MPVSSPSSIDRIYEKILAASDEESHGEELAQIDGYITECRSIYQNSLINERTRQEYEKMWQELRSERRVKDMSENSRFLYETIAVAESYESTFKLQLNEAVKNKWIGKKTQDNWMNRFNNPDVLEWDRKKWIQEEFPNYLAGWEETANTRKEVWKLAKELKVDEKRVPELEGVLKIQDFLSLHFFERKHKIHAAKAALLALKNNQRKLLETVKSNLKKAQSDKCIHPSKVGAWMQRVMESENPQLFFDEILKPFINNWKSARKRFDTVTPQLKQRKDITRGFKQLSATAFLLLDYDDRIVYLEEAESRLKSNVNEEGPLAALRLDIRHAMDTGHWEEAELLLEKARKIDVNDKAVRSMGRYLETHRTDKKEKEGEQVDEKIEKNNKVMEALLNLRSIMGKLPPNMRVMTEKALNSSNPNTLKRLWQCFYNRHWVIMNGYSTPKMDREESESEINQQQTDERIANGHEQKFERNSIKGKTANDAGIRDECEEPQVLYTNRSGISEVYEGVERNADNAKFGYWTTIVDDEVPYELLREAVLSHMFHIKQNAKILRESGLSYSSYGNPSSKN